MTEVPENKPGTAEEANQGAPEQSVTPPAKELVQDADAPANQFPEIEDATFKLNTFYNQITGTPDREISSILIDHCYSRPWNWRPESHFLRPTKTLFVSKPNINRRRSTNPLAPLQDGEEVLDVETIAPDIPPVYDETRAKQMMEECERHASMSRGEKEEDVDWEEGISRVTWTPIQNRLFNGMVGILNADHMSRLAYSGVHNEPILRRTIIEKSVKRVRKLLGSVSWDSKLTQWLHHLLLDNLSTSYLAAYLDILQTLRSKLPSFVDKMMCNPNATGRLGGLNYENLFGLLKKPWDPVASTISHEKPKKLPGGPIIVVVPTTPTAVNSVQNKRLHKWINLMTNLAHVVQVSAYIGSASHRMTMTNCVDQMLASTRSKLQEVRAEFPGKNIVLVGFNAGAALALQVAQVEPVLCVVCLGFSLLTAEGKRGDPDDNLLELQCPVLFVIGQRSNTSLQEDMEDLRERMRVETGLIVVGAADDYLRVNKKKKRAEGITQSLVDRFIVDEVGEFVSGILLSPCPPQLRQSPVHFSSDFSSIKRSKVERKRYNSNGSSVDSEPPSPTIRMSRPVGRPPGSKSKTKLESRWSTQLAQGTHHKSPSPCSSPPPSLTPITPDTSSTDSSSLTDKSMPLLLPNLSEVSKPTKNIPIPSGTERPKKSGAQNSSSPSKSSSMAGSTLSHLLQGNYRSTSGVTSKSTTGGIKMLENVTLNAGTAPKLMSGPGRNIDLSKITVLNSISTMKSGTSAGNLLLMPDGKLKAVSASGKTPGTTKYITSKKQLLGNRPPKAVKKMSYVPSNPLPPPANLTSQDIMDLPIVFADDNQILTRDNTIQPDVGQPAFKIANPTTSGKFVFLNKQPVQGNASVMVPPPVKKPMTVKSGTAPIKFTKIILSKRPVGDEGKTNLQSRLSAFPSDISIRKVEPSQSEPVDLENELVATAVPNPNFAKDLKNVTVFTKQPDSSGLSKPLQVIINEALAKRSATLAQMGEDPDPDDPDYKPPKNMKLESL